MSKTVMITGGAGFIGSHAADELLRKEYNVKIFDNLTEQVHGETGKKPPYLNSDAEFIRGGIRDRAKLKKTLTGVDAVFNIGSGQSYTIREIARETARVLGKEHIEPELPGPTGWGISATVLPTSPKHKKS